MATTASFPQRDEVVVTREALGTTARQILLGNPLEVAGAIL